MNNQAEDTAPDKLTLEFLWQQYAEVKCKNLSYNGIEFTERKKMFYTGNIAMLNMLMEIICTLPKDDADRKIAFIIAEYNSFVVAESKRLKIKKLI